MPCLTPATADKWAACPCSDYVPIVMKADSKTADLRWALQTVTCLVRCMKAKLQDRAWTSTPWRCIIWQGVASLCLQSQSAPAAHSTLTFGDWQGREGTILSLSAFAGLLELTTSAASSPARSSAAVQAARAQLIRVFTKPLQQHPYLCAPVTVVKMWVPSSCLHASQSCCWPAGMTTSGGLAHSDTDPKGTRCLLYPLAAGTMIITPCAFDRSAITSRCPCGRQVFVKMI